MIEALIELALNTPTPSPVPAPSQIVQTITTTQSQEQQTEAEPSQESAEEDSGETVIVRAKKLSKPFANVTFDRMDIYTNPASKADALLAVADLQFATNNSNSADIVLRGGLARLTRVYFNDVPIYEAVRGSSLLQTTNGFSIFNTSVIKSIETYSTAPPAYFANTAGGAVRILPDDEAYNGSNFEVNTTRIGFGLTRQLKQNNGSYVQIYGDHRNLKPLLLTNPKLEEMVISSRGLNFGINSLLRLSDKTELRLFTSNDIDEGLYPFSLFDPNRTLGLDKKRSYNIASVEREIGNARLKIDVSKSFVEEQAKINQDVFTSKNQYTYIDANMAGRVQGMSLSYRYGATFEEFNLKTNAQFTRPQIGFADSFIAKGHEKYGAVYGFATYQPKPWLSIAIGGREYFDNDLKLKPTRQISASINDIDSRHKIIAAYGEYGSVVLPSRSAFEGISTASSQQASLDYKYTFDANIFAIGIYQKIDNALGSRTKISGIDMSYAFMPRENIEVSGTIARTLPHEINNGLKERGTNHLDYLFKQKIKIGLGNGRSMNFNYTTMSGQVYSLPIGTSANRIGDLEPIFSRKNNLQMGDFQSLDFNFIQRYRLSEKLRPIFYLNINNLFDRKNDSDIRFNDDFTQHKFGEYLPRTIVIGTLIDF